MGHSPARAAFAAATSTHGSATDAAAEAGARVRRKLDGPPELAFAFFSPHHLADAERLAGVLCEQLGTDNLIGCSGESVVGMDTEYEGVPALAVWGGHWPGARIVPMHLDFARTPEGGSLVGWPDELPESWPAGAALIACGDPYSFPIELLLDLVSDEHPGVPVIGGMASAASQPGENVLLLGRDAFTEGCVAAWVGGGVRIRTMVSQGCRPIGQHFVVTKAERNVILELGGVPAYQRLVEVYQTLATSEQAMVRQGLHIGRVVSEYQDHFQQGDFLVRNVVGIDPRSGVIAIADQIRVGQTVQFHIRDAETADAELRQLLAEVKRSEAPPRSEFPSSGALLFSCNGRGTRLFATPHHDAGAIARAWGPLPLAGFFAAGELGPVGGRNFIHGFTASVALFEPA